MDTIYKQGARRIGIMGGTFNPIHYGHLVTAETARVQFNMDQVLFIPSGNPPHKKDQTIVETERRYMMTVLAVMSNPDFYASRIEIDREGYSYSIDTIHELQQIYGPETEICFITGADAFYSMNTWHRAEELMESCHFIAATRPGFDKEDLLRSLTDSMKNNPNLRISFLDVPALSISSSDIRQRIENGLSIRYLLPESVEAYIHKYHLYERK